MNINSKRIRNAMDFAAKKHLGQERKAGEIPYIVHPYSVATILSKYTDDEDIIVAGLLHDVLEDVKGYRYNDMKRDFGKRVADLVKQVSENKDPNKEYDEKKTWKKRKIGYIKKIENGDIGVLLICAADKLHNLYSLLDAYHEYGKDVFNNFNAPVQDRIWFYGEILKILNDKLPCKILIPLNSCFEKVNKIALG